MDRIIVGMQLVDFAPLGKEKEEEKPSKPADLEALRSMDVLCAALFRLP